MTRGLDCDVAVIGGGVVGLASAAALAAAGRSVCLLERFTGLGREASSRNSGVIHAGLHYPPDSLKARLCVEGRERLYAHCAQLGLPHRRTGKWVVAVEETEIASLEAMEQRGRACGAGALEWVDGASLARRAPGVCGVAALHSPETGLVDAPALCLSLAAEAESAGAQIALGREVRGIEPAAAGYRLTLRAADDSRDALHCAAVVNAAGLGADRVAEAAGLDVDARGYRHHPCRGDYFALVSGAPLSVEVPVYPVPAGPGLGIHATPDLAGRVCFGPDARYVDDPADLRVDAARATAFAEAARRYLPALRPEWLSPDQAGVRARLAAPGEAFRDFVVAEESEAGLPGFVNCLGIESPGLTASLAIGARVSELLASL